MVSIATKHDHDVSYDHSCMPVSSRWSPSLYFTIDQIAFFLWLLDIHIHFHRRFSRRRLFLFLKHQVIVSFKVWSGLILDQEWVLHAGRRWAVKFDMFVVLEILSLHQLAQRIMRPQRPHLAFLCRRHSLQSLSFIRTSWIGRVIWLIQHWGFRILTTSRPFLHVLKQCMISWKIGTVLKCSFKFSRRHVSFLESSPDVFLKWEYG